MKSQTTEDMLYVQCLMSLLLLQHRKALGERGKS